MALRPHHRDCAALEIDEELVSCRLVVWNRRLGNVPRFSPERRSQCHAMLGGLPSQTPERCLNLCISPLNQAEPSVISKR